ncbi:hypothetical protein [Haloarchaeobius baliensis]|uniref:hypothetical protein n=1 Tax=Haloarchaeobius baliensis TaxID=1670458 RepID=UPI003F880E0F
MPPSRRSLLVACTAAVPLLAGCSALGESGSVERVTVELSNGTKTERAYHVLLGTTDGLRELAVETIPVDETTVVEADTGDFATITGLHVVVGEYHVSADRFGPESGSGCLRYLLYQRPESEPQLWSSADTSCEE